MGQTASCSCAPSQLCHCDNYEVDQDYVVPREGGLTQEQRNKVHEEFVSVMLGAVEKRGCWKDLRVTLQKSIQRDPRKLTALVDRFKRWDRDGDGFITMEEITEYLEQLAAEGDRANMQRPTAKMAETFRQEFDIADVDGDNKLDPWEVLAFTLGRRKAPVELLLYDISGGLSKRFSGVLLGKKFEAIYHASLLVFGSEYWYGGNVFKSKPPCDKIFGRPLKRSITNLEESAYNPELMVIRIGYTLVTPKEFDRYLHDVLAGKYTQDNYDVLTHNCISFADEAAEYLTGMHLPDVVRHLADNMLAAPMARMCRPFLNRWLGGFGGTAQQGLQDRRESGVEEPVVEEICSEVLGEGELVNYAGEGGEGTPATAVVTEDTGDGYGIRFFDPRAGEFRTADHVPKSRISAAQQ